MKLQSLFLRTSLFVSLMLLFFATQRVCAQLNAQSNAQSAVAIQTSPVPARITQAIDETQLVRLKGNVHPLARPEFDQGPVSDGTPMKRMMLVLQRSPEQEAALQTLLGQQHAKDSPNFHRWLTPQQFGAQFGPADVDIQTVTGWLAQHGFQQIKVAAGKTVIEFSGTAGQVRNAFQTEIHHYLVDGQMRQANSADPQIPAALAPAVAGIVSLHNFPRRSMKRDVGVFSQTQSGNGVIKPSFTTPPGCGPSKSQPCYIVSPADFAKIYNVPNGLNGTPPTLDGTLVSIAIVANSNINAQDVIDFRALFGLPANFTKANIILNGPDPGVNANEAEADLDTQVAGMVAPGATIDLVVSEDTLAAGGIDLSALYIVDNNIAPVMSESFGACEPELGTGGNQFHNSIWEQAAAEGITVLVSAGDNGSAGCDDFTKETAATHGLAVNGIASTPFNVAVGGTDFDDATRQTNFWSSTNGTGSRESAMGYIPEIPWNNSCAASATSNTLNTACATANNILGGSGGPSSIYAKPSWQSILTPADGHRDLPDVALFASDGASSGSFYMYCEADAIKAGSPPSCVPDAQGQFSFVGAGGTSVSSPAFAGIMALINQQSGRQGNANFVFYKIAETASSMCNSSVQPLSPLASCNFYDITSGNDSVPCQGGSMNCSSPSSGTNGVLVDPVHTTRPGWTTGAGYDEATGLGSVNVANLAAAWKTAVGAFKPTTTSTKINGATTPVAITHGQSVTLSATVTAVSGIPTGDVSFLAPTAVNGGIGPAPLGNGAATLTSSTAGTPLPGGSYNIRAHYAGDGNFAPSDDPTGVPVIVTKENSKLQTEIVTLDAGGNPVSANATNVAYGSRYVLRMDILNSTGIAGAGGNCQLLTTKIFSGCAFDATGTVTLTGDGSPLDGGTFAVNSRGSAEDHLIQLLPGTHSISATYSGDISYNPPAAATALALTVTQAATSTSVTPNPNSITSGGNITLTALIATNSSGAGPTGTVQFKNGSTALGSAVNCVPAAGSSSASASCSATLSTTLALLPLLTVPNRLPTLPVPWILLAVSALLVLLLSLKRVPPRYRRAYACAGLLVLVALVTGLAVGCGGGYGGGGPRLRYDSITAVYSGDSNYTGSTSPAVQITIQ